MRYGSHISNKRNRETHSFESPQRGIASGPGTLDVHLYIPKSLGLRFARYASTAVVAAYGVDLRAPLNPAIPMTPTQGISIHVCYGHDGVIKRRAMNTLPFSTTRLVLVAINQLKVYKVYKVYKVKTHFMDLRIYDLLFRFFRRLFCDFSSIIFLSAPIVTRLPRLVRALLRVR